MKEYTFVHVYHNEFARDFKLVNDKASQGWKIVTVTHYHSIRDDRSSFDTVYMERDVGSTD